METPEVWTKSVNFLSRKKARSLPSFLITASMEASHSNVSSWSRSGGNFVKGLIILSPFNCNDRHKGEATQNKPPRKPRRMEFKHSDSYPSRAVYLQFRIGKSIVSTVPLVFQIKRTISPTIWRASKELLYVFPPSIKVHLKPWIQQSTLKK